ncbi:type II toxin-antitoxin system VapC family toxin [Novosphingobium lentum]|uniref:type II toxin-antitoxin system VapC family toxin n=1 Tax=Novosphingobium lentum TaxID=145287 RepID=UPI00082DF413|nr:type II toxin-antitoxin system VapC family toxin [Novosphingobium lentum]
MAVVIDTSVWIEHFRQARPEIAALAGAGDLLMHPFVIGELALGSVPDRERLLRFLGAQRSIDPAAPAALLVFIDEHRLHGSGIGYVDAQLLKGCHDHAAQLATLDRRLAQQADKLGLLYAS